MQSKMLLKIKSHLLSVQLVRTIKSLILSKIIAKDLKRALADEMRTPYRKTKNGKFIFIHINKNGGTSVAKAIGSPKKKHFFVKEIIPLIGENKFNKAFVFTVVRNPWDRAVSQYNYRVKTNQNNLAVNNISFMDWIKYTYGKNKNYFYYDNPRMFATQSEWLKDKRGEIRVNNLIKFESLNKDYNKIANKLGLSTELPHLNATKREPYSKYYDQETKEIVRLWFKEDIERFNYSFD